MIIALWIVSGLLAAMYLLAGGQKVFAIEKYRESSPWSKDASALLVRGIGVLELLGAIGLILPKVTNIVPGLTVWAAVGLVLVQVGAISPHVVRKEYKVLPVNIGLLLGAVFVVVGWTYLV
jgi:uncharacterized membrane protein